jgi:hypothetical protein
VVFTTVIMALLVMAVAIIGILKPSWLPWCFAPQNAGRSVIVCPTEQSPPFIPFHVNPLPLKEQRHPPETSTTSLEIPPNRRTWWLSNSSD